MAVYPRGCGEARSTRACDVPRNQERSIPAGAGKPAAPISRSGWNSIGSIPAGAGKPDCLLCSGEVCWSGLSPRVRGSPVDNGSKIARRQRSIPAGAGKPPDPNQAATRSVLRVYPRGCGEAPECYVLEIDLRGFWVYPRGCGEAWYSTTHRAGPPTTVYPRGCGEAPGSIMRRHSSMDGSIPAGAGKPSPSRRCHVPHMGLSPRVRGSHLIP